MTIEEKIATLPEGWQFVSLHFPITEGGRHWAYAYPPQGKNWRPVAGWGNTPSAAIDNLLGQVKLFA